MRWLGNSEPQRVLSYQRSLGGESLTVLVNLSSQPFSGTVDAEAGAWRDITPGGASAVASLPKASLAPWEFRVFRRE